jgi:hypothetical protein
MSRIGDVFTAAQSETLRLDKVIITDWRDGPIEGIARLSVGEGLWSFRLFAEITRPDDLNERLFLLSPLSTTAIERRILELVADLPLPLVWPFDSCPDSAAITSAVDAALESASPATLVISSVDFNAVLKAWSVE